jgi:hypothetical protein
MVSHVRAKITVQFSFWRVFSKKKGGGSFFWGNSGRVGRTYLVVMAPIFKGQPELMAAIPHFNGPTTQLTTTFIQTLCIFPRGREFIGHNHIQAFLLHSPSLFLLLLFLLLVFLICC